MMPVNASLPAVAQRLALVESDHEESEKDVRDLLDVGKTGKPVGSLLNVYTVLARDSRWEARVKWSTFQDGAFVDGKPVDDDVVTGVTLWLDRVYMLRAATENVVRAITHLAKEHPFHPVRDWLDGLTWDGVARVDALVPTYLGGIDTPLNRKLAAAWMIAAVARIYDPGCKFDNLLILVGGQGEYKSQACAALCPNADWLSDTPFLVGDKDAYGLVHGIWIYELAELKGLRGATAEAIKAFLSSRKDRFRRPYGRFPEVHLRSVAFIGTTNLEEFLADETGSRRFWPIYVGIADLVAIMRDREQLWAEAVHRYRAGERWWLDREGEELLKRVSLRHQVIDAWQAVIARWMDDNDAFTIDDVLRGALQIPVERWDQGKRTRVGTVLARLGCRKSRPDEDEAHGRPRMYTRPAGWTKRSRGEGGG